MHKYLKKDTLSSVKHKQSDSPIWTDLLKVRDLYIQGRRFIVGDGKLILFWRDKWLYDQPLMSLFPDLYKMTQQPDITLAKVKLNPGSLTFSRWLVGEWKKQWDSVLSDMNNIFLKDSANIVKWSLSSKGLFTVRSMYNALTSNDSGPYHKKVWKSKIPAKIQIFLWLVLNNAILTKDNMIKRKWQGNPACYFCDQNESASHLLFHCNIAKAVWATFVTCIGANDIPSSIDRCWLWFEKWLPGGKKFHTLGIVAICWAMWKARNKLCFEGKSVQNPISIVCHACALMCHWAGLYQKEDKELLEAGVNTMLQIALKLLCKKTKPPTVLLLKDDSEDS
jgi:hypothetical protein